MDDEDKKLLFQVLKQAGITKVTVCFDGGGDSGQIDSITAEGLIDGIELRDIPIPPDGKPLSDEFPGVMGDDNTNIYSLIESVCYSLLEHDSPCDWINNDGGYGEIYIVPEAESIHLDMNERIQGSELHELELGFYTEDEEVTQEVTNG